LALIEQSEGLVARILEKANAKPEAVAKDLRARTQNFPKVQGSQKVMASSRLQKLFQEAEKEAKKFGVINHAKSCYLIFSPSSITTFTVPVQTYSR
jgi:ATP-dependent Clp protease ATP-binding subunit ClpA